ncbi:MAG: tetratricopeptide repeat protein [Treponema sp.]|nr:tetratricopeptide repeat protein [Treponema sp.]
MAPSLSVYLGVAYYQVGKYESSIQTFEKGMQVQNADIYALCLNAGNSAFAMENYTRAQEYYSRAVAAAPDKGVAFLNRANANLKIDKLELSKTDYEQFLQLDPENPQADNVRRLLPLLIAEIERRRLLAEENAAKTQKLTQEESTPILDEYPEILSEHIQENMPVQERTIASAEQIAGSEAVLHEQVRDVAQQEPLPAGTQGQQIIYKDTAAEPEQIQSDRLPSPNSYKKYDSALYEQVSEMAPTTENTEMVLPQKATNRPSAESVDKATAVFETNLNKNRKTERIDRKEIEKDLGNQ